VLKGTYEYRIDPKGRLPVPPPFRRLLLHGGERTVVVTPLDQCLAIYSPAEWTKIESQLTSMPPFHPKVKALTRLVASRAVDCELDSQGRILIPLGLRRGASLDREVTVVGVLNRLEIWPTEAWQGFLKDSERILDDISTDLPWPIPATSPPPEGSLAEAHPQAKPSR
jgi:MraZ protein